MRRRTMLLAAPVALAAAASGTASATTAPLRRPAGLAPRRLLLRHAATGARFSGPYHDGCGPDPAALEELSAILGDHRSGEARRFDPRVLDILWELGRRERVAEFVVLSGYRTPETNAAVCGAGDSQHLRAAALDVQAAAARIAGFAAAAIGLGRGGVGVYARRGFVHLDSGPVRRWGDAPGEGGPAPAEDPLARVAKAWAAATRPW